MSKKHKVVKLSSKTRVHGKKDCVVYNGVEMTRAEREALIRAQTAEKAEESKPVKQPKIKKGTKVAEPRHSKLFNLLHPNRKQTAVPTLKSVDLVTSVEVHEPVADPTPIKDSTPIEVANPVEVSAPVDEEDDLTQPISRHNAKKRISPAFVKRVATVSAKSCDELIEQDSYLEKEISNIESEISKAKTPKDASPELRAQLNAQRKTLRDQKKALVEKREMNREKAIALEKAADGYCDIYKLLTDDELSLRKTARINPYNALSSDEEQSLLLSLV